MNYNQNGNDFAAQPRVIFPKYRFKDPYGTNQE